jgi:hypothetical protein
VVVSLASSMNRQQAHVDRWYPHYQFQCFVLPWDDPQPTSFETICNNHRWYMTHHPQQSKHRFISTYQPLFATNYVYIYLFIVFVHLLLFIYI